MEVCMAYQEVTETSWFSRLGSSFSGMGLGLALLVGGTILLWWNEGDFVATRDALNETQAITEELGDVNAVNNALNGKVVHASGYADTSDILTDSFFGVSEKAISLQRSVEYFQWVEHKKTEKRKKLGGGEETVTTYTYSQEWTARPVSSANFHDPSARQNNVNRQLVNVENERLYATNVRLGAYRLPDFFIRSISGSAPMTEAKVSAEARARIQSAVEAVKNPLSTGNAPLTQGTMTSMISSQMMNALGAGDYVHEQGDTIYVGRSPAGPENGDVRVKFTHVLPADVSIIARLKGDTFEKYVASNGKSVDKLAMGNVNMETMYGTAHSGNSTMTWLLRGLGIILVIAGFKCILAPLAVIASVIPLLGDIVGAGTGLVSTLLGCAWSLVIISIAWLRFRPVIGFAMIGTAVVLLLLLLIKGRKNKAQAA